MEGYRIAPLIYISGPLYSSGVPELNVRRALHHAEMIMLRGFVPVVPHLYLFWNAIFPHTENKWLDLDRLWIMRCDAVFRLDGYSKGGEQELQWAELFHKPIFRTFDELDRWYEQLSSSPD